MEFAAQTQPWQRYPSGYEDQPAVEAQQQAAHTGEIVTVWEA